MTFDLVLIKYCSLTVCCWFSGWVCYAEKTHGSYILPYISTTRSPQQVMGALVKDYFATSISRTAAQVYHVTVMPCFDKKLEASRADFYDDLHKTRDVDCVITSSKYGYSETAGPVHFHMAPTCGHRNYIFFFFKTR